MARRTSHAGAAGAALPVGLLIKWERSTDQRRRDVARFVISERDAFASL